MRRLLLPAPLLALLLLSTGFNDGAPGVAALEDSGSSNLPQAAGIESVEAASSARAETSVSPLPEGRGIQRIEAEKSPLWDSPDTDWVKWAVVKANPTRIYMPLWTDEQRAAYIEDFDPDIVGLWGGQAANRGEFMRLRGIAEIAPEEYEYQETIAPMFNHGRRFFTDNGLAIKLDGTVALRPPWRVPYTTVMAPKWRELVAQGLMRLAEFADGVFQDNIANTMDAVGGGNFTRWDNHFFKEYLRKNFDAAELKGMGIQDLDTFEIREYITSKRADIESEDLIESQVTLMPTEDDKSRPEGKDTEELIRDPVVREYIRFNHTEHLRIWVSIADRAKRVAAENGRPVPLVTGNKPGAWGGRVMGLPISAQVDSIFSECSALFQKSLKHARDVKDATSTLLVKAPMAASNFEAPVFVLQPIGSAGMKGHEIRKYPSADLRAPTALVFSEVIANGGVPIQNTFLTPDLDAPRGQTHKNHAQFVSGNRHIFTDRSSVANVALLQSLPSLVWRGFTDNSGKMLSTEQPHREHYHAAARFLEDHHILYESLLLGHPDFYDDTQGLERLRGYDMLVVPAVDCISDRQAAVIHAFVQAGGTLVLWGSDGPFDEDMRDRAVPAFDVIRAEPGNGEIIDFSQELVADYRENDVEAEETILGAIRGSGWEPLLETDLPEDVWVNLWEYGAGPMRALHLINYDVSIEEDSVDIVEGAVVRLRVPEGIHYEAATFLTPSHLSGAPLPDPVTVDFEQSDGWVEVTLPPLEVYGILVLSTVDELPARHAAGQLRKFHERLKIAGRARRASIEPYQDLLAANERLLAKIQGDVAVAEFGPLIAGLEEQAEATAEALEAVRLAATAAESAKRAELVGVEAVRKFDFGGAEAPAGWTAVGEGAYDPAKGYGWTDLYLARTTERPEPDPLHADFIRSRNPNEYAQNYEGNRGFPYHEPPTHPSVFRVDLPDGDYVVTVLSGDFSEFPMKSVMANEGRVATTLVDANEVPVLYGVRLPSGEFIERSFPVSVSEGVLLLRFHGDYVGPLYHNSIEWLVNGLVIQTPEQASTAAAEAYRKRADQLSRGALRDWQVIGPFDDDDCTGMTRAFGPESDPDPDRTWEDEDGTLAWRWAPPLRGLVPRLDLAALFDDIEEQAAFAQARIYCHEPVSAELAVNLSQIGVVYLNGEEVVRDELSTGSLLEEESVLVQLPAGWNTLLVKTLNHWGTEWNLHLSLLEEGTGTPVSELPGVRILAPPESASAPGGTVSYWTFDDWTGRTFFDDAAGDFRLRKAAFGTMGDPPAVDPVPNPDALLGEDGGPNGRSYRTVSAAAQSLSTTFNMDGEGGFTLEGWLYWNGGGEVAVVAATRSRENPSGFDGWEILVQPSNGTAPGRIDWRMIAPDGSQWGLNSGDLRLLKNGWNHFAVVWDPSENVNGTASLYLDGVLAASQPAPADWSDASLKHLTLGGRDAVADGDPLPTEWRFNGRMDEFRFSDKALEPQEFLNAGTEREFQTHE